MFVGHYAVAFAAKSAAPKTSLGTLFIAAQLVDLVWPVLLLLGVEHARIDPGNTAVSPMDFYDYPLSHSLLAAFVWALVFGAAYYAFRKYRAGAMVAAGCVVSHWILDAVSHRPDLPLAPGSASFVGLGLWNSVVGTFIVEFTLLALGVALYIRTTASNDRIGVYALWSLVAFIGVIGAANIVGSPPPSIEAVAITGNAGWLLVLWATWVDRHRRVD